MARLRVALFLLIGIKFAPYVPPNSNLAHVPFWNTWLILHTNGWACWATRLAVFTKSNHLLSGRIQTYSSSFFCLAIAFVDDLSTDISKKKQVALFLEKTAFFAFSLIYWHVLAVWRSTFATEFRNEYMFNPLKINHYGWCYYDFDCYCRNCIGTMVYN